MSLVKVRHFNHLLRNIALMETSLRITEFWKLLVALVKFEHCWRIHLIFLRGLLLFTPFFGFFQRSHPGSADEADNITDEEIDGMWLYNQLYLYAADWYEMEWYTLMNMCKELFPLIVSRDPWLLHLKQPFIIPIDIFTP